MADEFPRLDEFVERWQRDPDAARQDWLDLPPGVRIEVMMALCDGLFIAWDRLRLVRAAVRQDHDGPGHDG